LVAQYAQACNLFPSPELEHKLDVLRRHCADVGRDYDEIEKTVMMPIDVGSDGAGFDELLERMRGYAELGVTHVHSSIKDVGTITPLEIIGERLIPEMAKLN
jgi:alkanesulfonate monooxygenase